MEQDMIVVDERVIAERAAEERQRLYAEHQQLAAATNALNNAGMTIEQMRAAIQQADDMKAAAEAYSQQQAALRREQERQKAAEKADRERADMKARAEHTKAEQRANWIAHGLDPDRFEAAWPQLELSIAQGASATDDAQALERLRRAAISAWNTP